MIVFQLLLLAYFIGIIISFLLIKVVNFFTKKEDDIIPLEFSFFSWYVVYSILIEIK